MSDRPVSTSEGMVMSSMLWRYVLLIAGLALLLAIPAFTSSYVQFVINLTLVFILVALGFNIVLGYLGQLAFANAAFFGIGAYAVAISMDSLGLPFWLAMLPAAAVGAIVGGLVGLPALRLKGYYLAIVTLVFGELMRWLYIQGGEITRGSLGIGISNPDILGIPLRTDNEKYYFVLITVILTLWLVVNILRSKFGRAWVAIRDNEPAAASLGFSPGLYKVLAFAVSGCIVAIAGGLFALVIGRVSPESFNLHNLLLHFTIVMVGGLGSVTGSVVGAVILTGAPELLRNFPGMEEILFSLILIGVLLFMPGGIYGKLAERWPAMREKLYRG